jgi:hypothetical protein
VESRALSELYAMLWRTVEGLTSHPSAPALTPLMLTVLP